jgi:large subunit ribosomal protein L9
MELILLADVRNLGRRGEIVKVKPGYGRNYLIPRGVALEATVGNKAFFEQQRDKIDARHTKAREEAEQMAEAISGVRLRISKRVGEKDTLYGSVTTGEIAEQLAQKGIQVNKRHLDLGPSAPAIKSLGDHKVTVDLHMDVVAELTVSVVAESE